MKINNNINEDTKINKNNNVESNYCENLNDISEISPKNVSLVRGLIENDEQNQKKLKDFKNLMDNLVNGLNDIKDI